MAYQDRQSPTSGVGITQLKASRTEQGQGDTNNYSRQERYIRLRHLRDRTLTASLTITEVPGLRRISDQTVQNRLREAGLAARRPVRRNVLILRHRTECLHWCRLRRRWTRDQWRTVLFTDESRFQLKRTHGHGERYTVNCVQEVDRFGGGSVMVWAGIRHNGRTALVHVDGTPNGIRYRNEILQRHVLPFMNVNGGVLCTAR